MLFNSIEFLLFFPVVVAGYFLAPHRFRWAWLLCASAFFYMAFVPAYILALLALILIDYTAGLFIARSHGKRKKWWLVGSIASNLGLLGFFKYYDFFAANVNALLGMAGSDASFPIISILLPVGLSFHTFQSMSYTIDVYRGTVSAERHLGYYALYVMFFPQLVAGPIERAGHLIPQFRERHWFVSDRVLSGARLMFWGFFKKIVVADRLAQMVDGAYEDPGGKVGAILGLATILFAFQIYCDFSGYVDIARGAARVMGFRLSENFNLPYRARTVTDFWRRWHMTLYAWFRDYVYIPLGGNRLGTPRTVFNILFVFLITGLWHGAEWTFVIWGLLHGAFVAMEYLTRGLRERIESLTAMSLPVVRHAAAALQTAVTFFLVCVAWVFFRAPGVGEAVFIIRSIAADILRMVDPDFLLYILQVYQYYFLSLGIMIVGEAIRYSPAWRARVFRAPRWALWPAGYALMAWMLWFGYFGEKTFIYFQF